MIPKIIHYCWFGKKEMPDKVQKCILSWKSILHDYEFKLWNEENFDINEIPYTKAAYDAGKYAYVSDYVRCKVMYEYGGIYLDTDIEVFKPFDDLLALPYVFKFKGAFPIDDGFSMAEKNHPVFKHVIDTFKNTEYSEKPLLIRFLDDAGRKKELYMIFSISQFKTDSNYYSFIGNYFEGIYFTHYELNSWK